MRHGQLLGGSWDVLGAFWAALGPSWAPSWGVLGRLEGILEASWSDFDVKMDQNGARLASKSQKPWILCPHCAKG